MTSACTGTGPAYEWRCRPGLQEMEMTIPTSACSRRRQYPACGGLEALSKLMRKLSPCPRFKPSTVLEKLIIVQWVMNVIRLPKSPSPDPKPHGPSWFGPQKGYRHFRQHSGTVREGLPSIPGHFMQNLRWTQWLMSSEYFGTMSHLRPEYQRSHPTLRTGTNA